MKRKPQRYGKEKTETISERVETPTIGETRTDERETKQTPQKIDWNKPIAEILASEDLPPIFKKISLNPLAARLTGLAKISTPNFGTNDTFRKSEMIVGSKFEGDSDEFLMNIQHDEYQNFIWTLFDIAKTEYLHAEYILNIETDLGKKLRQAVSFDHRLLQNIHDIIAAHFRYLNPDSTQFPLLENNEKSAEEILDAKLRQEWTEFFRKKANEIARNPNYCRQILTAVIYKNFNLADEILSDLIIHFDFTFTAKAEK